VHSISLVLHKPQTNYHRYHGAGDRQHLPSLFSEKYQSFLKERSVEALLQMISGEISDNVGDVKPFLSVLTRALRRARHFALLEKSAVSNQGSLSISFRSGTQSDPCISSIHNLDHDC
jgi:hypothetical protein